MSYLPQGITNVSENSLPNIPSSKLSRDYGYCTGGYNVTVRSTTDKYDDSSDSWTVSSNLNIARYSPAAFSIDGYGYTAGGYVTGSVKTTEKYDGISNTWSSKKDLNTAREDVSGIALNNFGYAIGGLTGGVGASSATEKYDNIANTWTTKTGLTTARRLTSRFCLSRYIYISGGDTSVNGTGKSKITERYNDIANTWTNRADITTETMGSAGFLLNGYGYYVAGNTVAGRIKTVYKYDDNSNTWSTKTDITGTARTNTTAFSINGYAYLIGGNTSVGDGTSAETDKYDDIADSWTSKSTISVSRYDLSAFSIGTLTNCIQNYDITEIYKRFNKDIITTDVTTSRAIDGTVYINNETYTIHVVVSSKCYIDTNLDDAYMQAFSDTNANPVTESSGIVGIQSGSATQVVNAELSFYVRPTYKYKVTNTISAGCSITLDRWFETTVK